MSTAPAPAGWRFRQPSVIPGFGLTLGFSLAYLTLIILIPLTALVWRSAALGWADFFAIATDRRTLKALQVSFGTAFVAAMVNVVFGTIVAWVLVRYRFPGRRIVDAMVDLPFALPTAVAGIALTTLYAPKGWIGGLLEPLGHQGRLYADWHRHRAHLHRPAVRRQDGAADHGGDRQGGRGGRRHARRQPSCRRSRGCCFPDWRRRSSPALRWPSRAVSANTARSSSSPATCPTSAEIAPLLIVIRLEEYDYAAATAIAAVMLGLSFLMLLMINLVQTWSRKRYG